MINYIFVLLWLQQSTRKSLGEPSSQVRISSPITQRDVGKLRLRRTCIRVVQELRDLDTAK